MESSILISVGLRPGYSVTRDDAEKVNACLRENTDAMEDTLRCLFTNDPDVIKIVEALQISSTTSTG